MGRKLIVAYSLFSVISLFLIEQVMQFSFVLKTLIKIMLFAIIPLLYLYNQKRGIGFMPHLGEIRLKDLGIPLVMGASVLLVVLGAYMILHGFIDLSHIEQELSKIGVTYINFIFIAFYITFINSFIEEFFFRGVISLGLVEKSKVLAYLFSSVLFAVYHIGIFVTWFSLPITAIALFGLFAGGLIFAWLNDKSRTILNSWIVHIFADISIILVGFILYGFF